MSQPRPDFDTAWKEVLERYFPDFIAFFFPRIHEDIDRNRGVEFLEQELRYAVRRAGKGRRTVDKLVKVWLNNGEEAWILVHVEIQSHVDPDFPQRMFICNSLLFGQSKQCVVSLGVLGDTQAEWRPTGFEYGRWNCRVEMEYPVVKLLDYADRWEELERSANPFAVVVMAHVKTQATRRKPETRWQWKVRLLRWLYQEGRPEEECVDLFRFLDLVMTLPPDLEREYAEALARYEEERKMPWISSYERRAEERGLQRGLQQGLQQATREGVLEVLHLRFAESPPSLREHLQQLDDPAALKELFRKAVTADSLEEFEQEVLATSEKG